MLKVAKKDACPKVSRDSSNFAVDEGTIDIVERVARIKGTLF